MARALIVLALVASVAHAETRPAPGGTILAPLIEQPLAAGDPARAVRWSDQVIALATSDGLYRDGKPALADGPPVAIAPMSVRIKLRPELRAHDGRPVTAADVAAALDRVLKGPLALLLQPVRAVQAVGPDTVELTLLRPAGTDEVTGALSRPQAGIPRTGPFVLARDGGSEVVLEAFPGYHGGRPWLDRVTLRAFASRRDEVGAFETGRAQVSLRGAHLYAHASGDDPTMMKFVHPEPATLRSYLGFAQAVPPEVRQAIALSIDRDAVRRFAARDGSWTIAGPPPSPQQARTLLAASGWKGRTLVLLVDRSRFEDEDVAQKILTQLAHAGVQVKIESVPAAEFERRIGSGREYDLYVGLCAAPAADPQLVTAWMQKCGADVEPLYGRGLRVWRAPELRGLRFDALGRLRFEDAFWWHR